MCCPGANETQHPGFSTLVVAVLCGVRGSLALSATLSISPITNAGNPMPGRDLAVSLCAGTIAATRLVSAVMMPLLQVRPTSTDSTSMTALQVHTEIALDKLEWQATESV